MRRANTGVHMVSKSRRFWLQAEIAVLAAICLLVAGNLTASEPRHSYEFQVKDVVYQNHGGKLRLARLYQPAGEGPFPAVIQIHGGAWGAKDRTDQQDISMMLVNDGIVVLSIDFRNSTEAPYPASLQDINYGIRWLKSHAEEFGSSSDRVGGYGTSSGGHQILLAATRPDDPRYRALRLVEAPDMDAKLAFVVSGRGVLYPLDRYRAAKEGVYDGDSGADGAWLIANHDRFFTNEATQEEAAPGLVIERGEATYLPPAFVYQGDRDQYTNINSTARFISTYAKAGGTIEAMFVRGEPHFFSANNPAAVETMKQVRVFIKKYGAGHTID